MPVTSFESKVRALTSAQRSHLLRHLDGALIGITVGADYQQTVAALVRLRLVLPVPHNAVRPRHTITSEPGRRAIAILLADAADALVRAGLLEAETAESPMDVLQRLKAAKQEANRLKLLESGLPGIPMPSNTAT